MEEKKSNAQIMSENFRDNCVTDGLTPYWIDLDAGIKLQKTILVGLPIPAKEVDFQDVQRGQTVYLQGKIMPMEKAGEPTVETKKMMVSVSDIYAKEGVLMIVSDDGKLLCSHDFSQEWQKVLDREKDMAIVRLANQAAHERGELYRPATYNLVKEMGFDLKALEFPEHSLCHKRLRNVTSAVYDFIEKNGRALYPSPEYINGLKQAITEAVESPIRQRQRDILVNTFNHCIEHNIPLVFASDITVFDQESNRRIPIQLNEVQPGRATILTQEQPMHNLGKDPEETSRTDVKIENAIRLDGGYILATAGAIIATIECHDLWVDHLHYHAPERYAAMLLADMLNKAVTEITMQDFKDLETKHSWIELSKEIPSDPFIDVPEHDVKLAYEGTFTPVANEYLAQAEVLNEFYDSCIAKGINDDMSFSTIYLDSKFEIIGPDGTKEEIGKNDIRPGMLISIDDAEPLLVEDCVVVRDELLLVADNTIISERDLGAAALEYQERMAQEAQSQQQEPETQEPNEKEIEK